ncbi:hypothetical protein CB1_000321001 [Camelus ferus]|nr:hypothetical protein CB1_000321001 [Camelus ferus]
MQEMWSWLHRVGDLLGAVRGLDHETLAKLTDPFYLMQRETSHTEKVIAYQREFLALKERLRIAEHRISQRSSELNAIVQQFRRLEDDIIVKQNYFNTIKNFALQLSSEEWMILEFSQLGFIGKMFQSPDLTLIVEFIFMFYKEKPIDWLLDHILWVKVCNPEKDADKDYMKPLLLKIHVNPPAEVSTSLKVYQGHTLEKTYMGEDFFWAITPVAGDYILFKFDKPVNVESYLFHSGNQEHPGDILLNTTVEVLPFKSEGLEISKETKDKRLEDGYFRIDDLPCSASCSPSVDVLSEPLSWCQQRHEPPSQDLFGDAHGHGPLEAVTIHPKRL